MQLNLIQIFVPITIMNRHTQLSGVAVGVTEKQTFCRGRGRRLGFSNSRVEAVNHHIIVSLYHCITHIQCHNVTQDNEGRRPHKNTQQSWWAGRLHFFWIFF